jgi:hypothetical protein
MDLAILPTIVTDSKPLLFIVSVDDWADAAILKSITGKTIAIFIYLLFDSLLIEARKYRLQNKATLVLGKRTLVIRNNIDLTASKDVKYSISVFE